MTGKSVGRNPGEFLIPTTTTTLYFFTREGEGGKRGWKGSLRKQGQKIDLRKGGWKGGLWKGGWKGGLLSVDGDWVKLMLEDIMHYGPEQKKNTAKIVIKSFIFPRICKWASEWTS